MSVPGESALYSPSLFPRVDSVPFDVEQSHGVAHDFGENFGLPDGSVSTLYDRATDYNSGVNAVNRPITHTFLVNSVRFGPRAYHHEALCFVRTLKTINTSLPASMQQEHELLSLSEFNKYLRSPEARRLFGAKRDASELREAWKFAGSVKRPGKNLGQQMISANDDAVPIVVAGRARITDIGRAYAPTAGTRHRPSKNVPAQRDHLYFLYRRYDSRSDLQADLEMAGLPIDPNGSVVEGATSPFYWQVDVHVNRNGQAPDVALYSDEFNTDLEARYIGDYDHIGFIGFVFGDRSYSHEMMHAARAIMKGSDDYSQALISNAAVEVHIGVH